jgi:hyperosmotically inducible periplasmic protein
VGTRIDDSVITAKVKSELLADPAVKGLDAKVETYNGIVQLSGFVDSQAQMDRAIEIARAVNGVNGVENKMNIKK